MALRQPPPAPAAALTYAAALATSAAGAALVERVLRAHPPGGRAIWERRNHAGNVVSLHEGPAYVGGAAVGAICGSWVGARTGRPVGAPTGAAAAWSAVAAGAVGLLDDLHGDSARKGLRGHVTALTHGQVTTGVVKIVGLAITGVVVADGVRAPGTAGLRRLGEAVTGGAVIAGSANLVNLLDLRPGRALKATTIVALALASSRRRHLAGASALGSALGTIGPDLAGRTMLGDTGANSAGALLGTAIVAQSSPAARAGVLAALIALTLASEKVSFTRVIESTPVLRTLDAWGRG